MLKIVPHCAGDLQHCCRRLWDFGPVCYDHPQRAVGKPLCPRWLNAKRRPLHLRFAAMESAMTMSVKQMIEQANALVPRLSSEEARRLIAEGALVIDVRDAPEVEMTGKVAGALHVSRGMLEFRADPDSPYHDKRFSREKPVLIYCASGGRSALSGKTLKDLGFQHVYNLGAFKEWADAGGETERPIEPGM
jgi:rhodanese-related sulfurtransferase